MDQTIISGLLHKIDRRLPMVVNVRMAVRKFEDNPYHEGKPSMVCFGQLDYPDLNVIDGLDVRIFPDVPRNHLRIVARQHELAEAR